MKSLVITLLMILSLGTLSAQTTEGQLTYKMDFSSDNPQMAAAIPMMQGSTLNLYFMKDKSVAEVSMGPFMKLKSIMDGKQDKGLLLTELMGQKTATEIESISKKKIDTDKIGKPVKTSETKTILGFNCKKYVIKDAEGKDDTVLWVTTDIKTSLKGQEQFSNGVEGVPLEFSTSKEGMDVHFEATNFNKTVDPAIFSIAVPEGYEIKTEEEMKQMGGGLSL